MVWCSVPEQISWTVRTEMIREGLWYARLEEIPECEVVGEDEESAVSAICTLVSAASIVVKDLLKECRNEASAKPLRKAGTQDGC